MNECIILGNWTEERLNSLMNESSRIKEPGLRINFISRQFLNTGYKESTLIGDIDTPEVFVINLEGFDCLTFIEYMEAMRLSGSFSEFKENLKRIRYRSGKVAFENRNHFFTDWAVSNSEFVKDITQEIGGQRTKSMIKTLNQKGNGTAFLKGIQPQNRQINYIPSEAIDEHVMDMIRTGDYAGIYTETQGLDVSHVGIIIKDRGSVYLRHASSDRRYQRVIEQDLKDYISKKPGLIVLRPR
jgi:hypothetical protein